MRAKKTLKQTAIDGYFVDQNGRVFSNKSGDYKELKRNSTGNGYLGFQTYTKGKFKTLMVHREVAKGFMPNPENKPCVNHINSDKQDNRVENLEWVTYSENGIHHYLSGNMKVAFGEETNSCKLTKVEVLTIRSKLAEGFAQRVIAKDFGVSPSAISLIARRKNWGWL